MSSTTLTSLAMLKVHVDQGQDYLDYLRPFILQVLVDHTPDPVTDAVVRDYLRKQFGLEIPERAVQIVLTRLARKHPLKKELGVYHITGKLADPGIATEKARASRHIEAVVSGLIEFSKNTARPITSHDEAVTAICAFLTQFNIPCLRAYLRGTAIPTIKGNQDAHIVLVSEYVLELQKSNPERFESFLVVVQGHMLANALLCPDLQFASKTYKGVTFYLDTPVVVRRLGLEGDAKKAATTKLIELLRKLGATVAVFSHSREELGRVVKGAANHVEDPSSRGTIVMEVRRQGTTKSDLLLLAGQLEEKLKEAQIDVVKTPRYIEEFQIDEKAFEMVLDDEVSYFNPRAREDDINSVRSIYVLRSGIAPLSVEKAQAVLVSSNSGFARAAFEYGKKHEESREVSSVVTDFSLANMAWLKAPLGSPSLPMTELLAFSYAAMQPSKALLDKYLNEIDKLEGQGKITPRDHQLLRSSALAQEELMRLTLGDEEALTALTVTETLSRVEAEIRKEESEKLATELAAHAKTQADHAQTQSELMAERERGRQVQEHLYWRCVRKARRYSWAVAAVVGLIIIAGIVAGLGITSKNPVGGWVLTILSALLAVAVGIDLLCGFSVRDMREKLEKRLLAWLVKREAAATGLQLEETPEAGK